MGAENFHKQTHLLLSCSDEGKIHIRYLPSQINVRQISSNPVQVHCKTRLRYLTAKEWKSCLFKMSSFQELGKIALFLARRTRIFQFLRWVLKGACKPKAHRSFSSHRGQCNPSFWIKTCEHHQDSSYSVRFSAKSGIRMHMGPGLLLHLSGCICPFTSLFSSAQSLEKRPDCVRFWRSHSSL